MVSKRSITTSLLIAAIAVGAGAAVMTPSSAQADECGKLKEAKTKKACAEGGAKAVKKLMQDMKKSLKGKSVDGVEFECKECHQDVNKGTMLAKTKTGGKDPAEIFRKFLAM